MGDTPDGKLNPLLYEITSKQSGLQAILTNRWLILTSALLKIILMFCVQWGYALSVVTVIAFLSFYIGQVNPGAAPGISEFNLLSWLRQIIFKCLG